MSFDEAIEMASRDDRFKATVYAMNTLLIYEGVYTQSEFGERFVEWIKKEQRQETIKQKTTSGAALAASQS